MSYDKIGNVLFAQGKFDGAGNAYRDGLAFLEQLAAAAPGNTQWQSFLVVMRSKLASVHQKLGDVTQALIELRIAHEILAALVAGAPGNAVWATSLAWLKGEIARLEGQAQETTKN